MDELLREGDRSHLGHICLVVVILVVAAECPERPFLDIRRRRACLRFPLCLLLLHLLLAHLLLDLLLSLLLVTLRLLRVLLLLLLPLLFLHRRLLGCAGLAVWWS